MILAKGTSGIASVPLAAAPACTHFIVDRVTGPDQRRLSEMGFVEGAQVKVVNRSCGGMVVVKLGGCRLALARGMADNVLVR